MDTERTAIITIGGEEYSLVLTTRATKEIAGRYGGLENLGDHLMKSENFEMAIGEITYMKERKVMCGPLSAVSKHSQKYFIISPGRGKAGKTAALMAKELNVPEEEVSRILPPGDCEIKQKVWPKEEEQTE